MSEMRIHFRHLMLYEFRKANTAKVAASNICAVYGEGSLSPRTCRKWFDRFRKGNFDLADQPRSGRPTELDEDRIRDLVDQTRSLSVQEMSTTLNIPKSSVHRHLKKMGMVTELDVWVPHQLTERNRSDRVATCISLLARYEKDPFLKHLVTGDEKWISYDNPQRKRTWTRREDPPQRVAKPGLHPRKVLLSVWWDYQGILYFEFLPASQTINSDKYCAQLDKLKEAIRVKRPRLVNRCNVVFHHDNARPHVAQNVQTKLREFGWQLLLHPPYSPDIAPSDYHLFRSMQHFLAGKKFDNVECLKTNIEQYFNEKPQKFYSDGIMTLPKRWEEVVEREGDYVFS